ncbi:hypothetical protein LJC11_01705 [Bacteroidales bacterium OttesenSCG-928-I21]|nr:hypothetical protein [Bacteroidales bacterium OttesenSCG-928-I21]
MKNLLSLPVCNRHFLQIVFFAFFAFLISCGSGTPKQQPNDDIVEQNSSEATNESSQSVSEDETFAVQPEDRANIDKPGQKDGSIISLDPTEMPEALPEVKEYAILQLENNADVSDNPDNSESTNSVTIKPNSKDNAITETEKISDHADKYTAILDVEENLKKGRKGNMRVWIGIEELGEAPEETKGMVRDSKKINKEIEGLYCKITPKAGDFTFDPEESEYLLVTPSGITKIFTVIPPDISGTYKISAELEFYKDKEGKELIHSKGSEYLEVVVSVDKEAIKEKRHEELSDEFWKKFKPFFAALIALLFGTILFVVRRFIKNKTGYDEKENSTTDKTKDSPNKDNDK